jgi:hypothetical protein
MRRRVEESDASVPPAELVDYKRWCADRGLTPFGIGGDVVSLRVAYGQFVAWEEQRREWAVAHGIDEGDLEMVGPAPFDPDLV